MMTKVYDPGDIKILGIRLTNYDKSAISDIRGQVISMSIYEDMEQPSVYAEIILKDGVNLVKDFPIIGEEDLDISYITPGRDKPSLFKLRVYTVTGGSVDPSNQSSVYVIKAVSYEHIVNSINLTERSFKDTVTNIVTNIVKTDIETNKSIFVEETRGIVPYTVPRMAPFQAIDLLRQRAIAKRPSGGVFVFFENQYGLNFTSIEKLIEDGKPLVGSKIFTHAPQTNADPARQTYSWRNIIQMEQLSKFDTVEKLSNGYYKNAIQSYDMLTKSFDITQFKISEHADKFTYSDKNATIPNTDSFLKTAMSGSPTYMFTPKDSSKGNDFIPDLMGYRQTFVLLFNQIVIRCMVYGDNYLSVGDLVQLDLPDTTGTTNSKTSDSRYSGKYLITKLRHIIVYEENKFKHQIVFDCNRTGVGT